MNELLFKDKLVQMTYSAGDNFNKGDFIVAKKDLDAIKNKYFLELEPYTGDATLKVMKQPKVAVIGYETLYVLEGLGFNLVDSYEDADVIVNGTSSSLGSIKSLIEGGTSYVGIGGSPILAIENSGLLPGLSRGISNRYRSYEGVLKAVLDTDSVITGRYSENDILYNKSGSWIETVPTTSKVLATLSNEDDFYVAGWWPGHEAAKGKPYIIQDHVGDATITLLANHITNRAHNSHQFRMLANAIYDGTPEVDEYGVDIKFIDPKLSFKLGGDADVTVEISNNAKEDLEATLIVALYNKTTKMMVNYSYITNATKPGDAERITTGFRVPSSGEYVVKAFVWDNWSDARPLSNVLEISVVD